MEINLSQAFLRFLNTAMLHLVPKQAIWHWTSIFSYDVVDVSRQALQIIGAALQQNIAQAYSKKSLADLK